MSWGYLSTKSMRTARKRPRARTSRSKAVAKTAFVSSPPGHDVVIASGNATAYRREHEPRGAHAEGAAGREGGDTSITGSVVSVRLGEQTPRDKASVHLNTRPSAARKEMPGGGRPTSRRARSAMVMSMA